MLIFVEKAKTPDKTGSRIIVFSSIDFVASINSPPSLTLFILIKGFQISFGKFDKISNYRVINMSIF